MNEFEKSNWNKADYSQKYLDEVDIYIPERENLLRILTSFYLKFIMSEKKKEFLILDVVMVFSQRHFTTKIVTLKSL